MTRRIIGATASLLTLVAGLWLVLSPFAIGFQAKDTDWTDATLTDVWTGIPLALVGLTGVIVFALALRRSLVEAGHVTPRPAAAAPVPAAAQGSDRSHEMDAVLAPLIAALARDIARDESAEAPRTVVGESASPAHHREYGRSAEPTEQTGAPSAAQDATPSPAAVAERP